MGALERVVVGEGWGGFAGTLLILLAGSLLVASEAPRLRGVLQEQPTPLACDAWLDGSREVRWVTLRGCAVADGALRGGLPVVGAVTPGEDVTGYYDEGALTVGARPPRRRVLGRTGLGFGLLLLGLWPVARRVMLERALPKPPPPPEG